jgi:nucleoside-diphosphate-sugar epimerase
MYDEAKRFAEALCFAYARERDVDIGIARLFNTYGPGMRVDDGRLIPTVIAQASTGQPITVHGDGTQTRSFCYVSDTVRALRRLMDRTGFTGPVNVGNPDERTINDVVRRVLDATRSSSRVRYVTRPGDDPDRRLPSIRLARAELGWAPTVAFATGLDLMLASERDLP